MSKNTNTVVRLKKNGITLEILAKPNTMKPYREGKRTKEQVLITDEIFSNSSKFQKAKNSDLKKCCGTDNKEECIQIILDTGDFPLTKKELIEMTEEKRRQIINYLHKYYQDPRVNPVCPHPVVRIEQALDTIKTKIDPHIPYHIQVRMIVKKLPDVLPCKPVGLPDDILESGSKQNEKGNKGNNRGKR